MVRRTNSSNSSISQPAAEKLQQASQQFAIAFQTFCSDHSRHPGINLDPLYALPAELLNCPVTEMAGWLGTADLAFERALQGLCTRYGTFGFFCGGRLTDMSLQRSAKLTISKESLQKFAWKCNLQEFNQNANTCLERSAALLDRLDAYRGWLRTNPLFLRELQQLRTRWESVISQLGSIPSFPIRSPEGANTEAPSKGQDVTMVCAQDFNSFYDRWQLQGLATWNLPQPRGANLSGIPWPASVASSATMVSMQVSPILPLPGDYPIRAMFEEAQRAQTPEHLQGWLQVQKQQHAGDLRYLRFRRMFLLDFYRDTVLAERYGNRFAGQLELLDRAFGRYLGNLSADSVKKLRIQMQALRRRDL